jgi:hypothetical protein
MAWNIMKSIAGGTFHKFENMVLQPDTTHNFFSINEIRIRAHEQNPKFINLLMAARRQSINGGNIAVYKTEMAGLTPPNRSTTPLDIRYPHHNCWGELNKHIKIFMLHMKMGFQTTFLMV